MKNSEQGNPTFAFIIMGVANFLAMIVFGMLYLLFTNDRGERNILLLLAAGVSMIAGILMFVLYGFFHKKLYGN